MNEDQKETFRKTILFWYIWYKRPDEKVNPDISSSRGNKCNKQKQMKLPPKKKVQPG